MKKILIIETGGTIAGSGENSTSNNYTAGVNSMKPLLEEMNFTQIIFNFISVCAIDSSDMNYTNMKKIAKTIDDNKDEYDGFVVTHGTDTLKESAYFLNLVIKTTKPVVLTCAMRAPTMLSSDGQMNLYDAITVATNSSAHNRGVMVVANNEIHSAREVDKISTHKADAFWSKSGILGNVYFGNVKFIFNIERLHTVHTKFVYNDLKEDFVDIAFMHVGARLNVNSNIKGLVLACFGSGTYPSNLKDKLDQLDSSGVIIVKSAKPLTGSVYLDEDYFISSNTLDPEKSKILLNLSLNRGLKKKEVEKIYETH